MTILTRFRLVTGALLLTMALTGCATFRVDSPKPSDFYAQVNGWSRDPITNQIKITVVFSSPVNRASVVQGKTLFLLTSKDPNAAGTVSNWSIDNKSFTFITTKTWDALLFPHPDDVFTLKIIGTDVGQGAVVSTANEALDGDYDGNPEGDYKMTFTLIG